LAELKLKKLLMSNNVDALLALFAAGRELMKAGKSKDCSKTTFKPAE
jgi:hypothetical protein